MLFIVSKLDHQVSFRLPELTFGLMILFPRTTPRNRSDAINYLRNVASRPLIERVEPSLRRPE
jgi:hypothetical protein